MGQAWSCTAPVDCIVRTVSMWWAVKNLSCMINGDHVYTLRTFLIIYPGIIFCLHLYCWWCPLHVPNKHSVSNLHQFIHGGMVHRTSLIWSYCNLCHFIVHGMVDRISLIWIVSTWSQIFSHYKALVWKDPKFIVFACTWTIVPNYSSVLKFHSSQWSLCMDWCAVLHVRVMLTQAYPNYVITINI